MRRRMCTGILTQSLIVLRNQVMVERDDAMDSEPPVSIKSTDSNLKVVNGYGRKRPFLIGVAGGTCCGKSEVCKKILRDLGQADVESEKRKVIILSQESFYRDLDEEETVQADMGNFNFDHPEAFDDNHCCNTLKKLQRGEQAVVQEYSFKTHSREPEYKTVYPADVILFEGILVLYNKDIRNLLDMKIFVDTDSDTRLARRVLRDTIEHGRDIDSVLSQYTRLVKPAFEDFTLPTKKYADVIIPRGADNTVAVDLIVQHIKDLLNNNPNENTKTRTRLPSESGNVSNKIRPH